MTLLVTSRKSFFSQFSMKLRQMYGWQLVRRHVATCVDHLLSVDNVQNTSQKILLYLRKERLDSAIIIGDFWQFGFSFTLAYFESEFAGNECSRHDRTTSVRNKSITGPLELYTENHNTL